MGRLDCAAGTRSRGDARRIFPETAESRRHCTMDEVVDRLCGHCTRALRGRRLVAGRTVGAGVGAPPSATGRAAGADRHHPALRQCAGLAARHGRRHARRFCRRTCRRSGGDLAALPVARKPRGDARGTSRGAPARCGAGRAARCGRVQCWHGRWTGCATPICARHCRASGKPALVMHGDRDRITPPRPASIWRQHLPQRAAGECCPVLPTRRFFPIRDSRVQTGDGVSAMSEMTSTARQTRGAPLVRPRCRHLRCGGGVAARGVPAQPRAAGFHPPCTGAHTRCRQRHRQCLARVRCALSRRRAWSRSIWRRACCGRPRARCPGCSGCCAGRR